LAKGDNLLKWKEGKEQSVVKLVGNLTVPPKRGGEEGGRFSFSSPKKKKWPLGEGKPCWLSKKKKKVATLKTAGRKGGEKGENKNNRSR